MPPFFGWAPEVGDEVEVLPAVPGLPQRGGRPRRHRLCRVRGQQVDAHGAVGVTWYDLRNNRPGGGALSADVWFAHSEDRGGS
jgi:hypothetical protein